MSHQVVEGASQTVCPVPAMPSADVLGASSSGFTLHVKARRREMLRDMLHTADEGMTNALKYSGDRQGHG